MRNRLNATKGAPGGSALLCALGCVAALWLAGAAMHCAAQTPADATDTAPQHQPLTSSTDFYTLHPGDTVDVLFRFTPEFNDEVTIGPDGRADLKSAGDIRMAGLTLPELKAKIVHDSETKLVNPEVTVSLKDFVHSRIVVAGDVQKPGTFDLRQPTTALQAVLLAGGPKEDSALGRVVLFRKLNSETAEVHVLQLSRYKGRTLARNDMLLQPDDMILVQYDNLEKFSRYVKLVSLGVYFNPIGNNGIY